MNLLFDLDGTLTDPREGITKSYQYALEELGHPVLSTDELLHFIGPSLRDGFRTILKTDDTERIEQGIMLYRERFETIGWQENILLPEVPETLEELRTKSFQLFLVTSKPHVFAARIVRYFDIAHYFEEIIGSELDGTNTEKAHLISHALQAHELNPQRTVMIGDRAFDIEGAQKNGVRNIGVTYGFGSRAELTTAGADWICSSPRDIVKAALSLLSAE